MRNETDYTTRLLCETVIEIKINELELAPRVHALSTWSKTISLYLSRPMSGEAHCQAEAPQMCELEFDRTGCAEPIPDGALCPLSSDQGPYHSIAGRTFKGA